MINSEPTTKTDILNALNNLAFLFSTLEISNFAVSNALSSLENEFKKKYERCRLCNQLISSEDEKLPLEEGACYNCKFGPTGDPEDTEER